jgi:hypothetical protein
VKTARRYRTIQIQPDGRPSPPPTSSRRPQAGVGRPGAGGHVGEAGSKAPLLYDWALIGTADAGRWPPARRSLRPGEKGQLELAFFRCWSPGPVTTAELFSVKREPDPCPAQSRE